MVKENSAQDSAIIKPPQDGEVSESINCLFQFCNVLNSDFPEFWQWNK